ncbi:hypothetical protein ABEB36_015507 [Hypothenemus hampei]|uniref:Uncharacterized protein n=1 Tax=Hypothenemus hampei TaxID=57062 RepID=A0ABD1DZM3_HYPHA
MDSNKPDTRTNRQQFGQMVENDPENDKRFLDSLVERISPTIAAEIQVNNDARQFKHWRSRNFKGRQPQVQPVATNPDRRHTSRQRRNSQSSLPQATKWRNNKEANAPVNTNRNQKKRRTRTSKFYDARKKENIKIEDSNSNNHMYL